MNSTRINGPSNIQWPGLTPIGHIESCFQEKFATPRQGCLSPSSRARLRLLPQVVGPGALDGLEAFTHIWLIWVFDQSSKGFAPAEFTVSSSDPNSPVTKSPSPSATVTHEAPPATAAHGTQFTVSPPPQRFKGKIRPPRGGGRKLGLFASRSPHRPNPLGLSLVKIENIDTVSLTLELSGIDLVNGTAVLDIKPYIEDYDSPPLRSKSATSTASSSTASRPNSSGPTVSRSLSFFYPQPLLPVLFADSVLERLKKWEEAGRLPQAKELIMGTLKESLQQDPRPLPYRKNLSTTGKSKDHFAAQIYNLNWRFRYRENSNCDDLNPGEPNPGAPNRNNLRNNLIGSTLDSGDVCDDVCDDVCGDVCGDVCDDVNMSARNDLGSPSKDLRPQNSHPPIFIEVFAVEEIDP